ncbi:MAG TPA: acyl-CoA synthetase [Candidatus Dormibacteraeota bacterium]|jgi:long-chain acyl-CoA synthetase|nr:acyl-CoA synthetase [Candidatus Dormibacteraeota bacterium]
MGRSFWSFAVAEPSRLALIDDSGRRFTRAELLSRSRRLVHGLRARGLGPGDAVAAVLPNSVEAIELYLATAAAGWYLVPINFHSVGPEIAYVLADSEARALVAHERFAGACRDAVAELGWTPDRCFAVGSIPGFTPYPELSRGQPDSAPPGATAGRVMHYTSGTTGRPKGVRRPLPGVAPEEFEWSQLVETYRLDPRLDHVHLCCTPWYHTAPLVFLAGSLHAGHAIVLMDGFSAERVLELIERHRVTHTLMVPTQFVRLLALPEETRRRYDLSSLTRAVHGAAPCPPEVKRRMIEWWGPVVTEYYASTEASGTVAFAEEWLSKPGTVGRPFPGAEVVIMDDDGNRLPPGEVGLVYFRVPEEGFEYFKDPEKTAAARRGAYLTVGDIGYLDRDGYLFLCDRRADVIISGGVNIYPAEVEAVLLTHPAVRDAAVIGVPNPEWGEEVKAVIEPAEGVTPGDGLAAEILEHCRGQLARYKIPRSVDFVTAMPRDPSGKLYRRKLRDRYWAGRERLI